MIRAAPPDVELAGKVAAADHPWQQLQGAKNIRLGQSRHLLKLAHGEGGGGNLHLALKTLPLCGPGHLPHLDRHGGQGDRQHSVLARAQPEFPLPALIAEQRDGEEIAPFLQMRDDEIAAQAGEASEPCPIQIDIGVGQRFAVGGIANEPADGCGFDLCACLHPADPEKKLKNQEKNGGFYGRGFHGEWPGD
ncbi:MAG: hypothetical protein BWY77_01970 [bacterium ADurb.Bin431]|nr:MAG: hypothetical protein BWY77_01970 [bacterium ADurb.Bin431]